MAGRKWLLTELPSLPSDDLSRKVFPDSLLFSEKENKRERLFSRTRASQPGGRTLYPISLSVEADGFFGYVNSQSQSVNLRFVVGRTDQLVLT